MPIAQLADLPGGFCFLLLLAVLSVPVGIYVLIRVVRSDIRTMRRDRGQCEKCGYDIRATPDRCPECGTCPSPAALPRK
jgi:hypothetical protein